MINGIILLNKPTGYTSHDIVNIIRKSAGQKRVGHAGTLDKNATGLLIILLGKATKYSEFLTAEKKVYTAEITLGITTDSDDSGGSVISKTPCKVTQEEVENKLEKYRGNIAQTPPRLSAVHIEGKRLYKLTRKGEKVELPVRNVEVYSNELAEFEQGDFPKFILKIECSKGTYIRSIARDIGEDLGCGGCISYLRRESSGDFMLKNAVELEHLRGLIAAGNANEVIISLYDALASFPKFVLKKGYESDVLNGKKLSADIFDEWVSINTGENVVISSFSKEPLAIMQSTDFINEETVGAHRQMPLKYVKVI